MNPLDWSGPEFLGLFFPLLVLAFMLAGVLRWRLRQPAPSSDTTLPRVEPYEAALLRGPGALVEAAVASLAQAGVEIVTPVSEAPGGWSAEFKDPDGHLLALYQTADLSR